MWRVLRSAPRHRALTAVAVAVAATAALAASTTSAYTSKGGTARVAGADRFGTAAAVSAAAFPSGASVAYLATGVDFSDALTAAAAAGGRAPVLLTLPYQLPGATATELRRLGPSTIRVVGGTRSIQDTVLASVHAAVPAASTVRVAGLRRFDTAAALSQLAFPNGSHRAYIATGLGYADALSAASAAAGHAPVLLVTADMLPSATSHELGRLGVGDVTIVGGQSAISGDVADAIRATVPAASVERVFGPDRFSTSVALSRATFPTGAQTAFVATGSDYPDALSAASLAAGSGPLLLVGDGALASPALAELQRLGATAVTAIGGVAAIGTDLFARLDAALTQPTPAVSPNAGAVVAMARAQLGKPYQYGGAGPDSFDCSGLTMVAWKAAGVTLPHNAEMQADMVAPVAIDKLQPGDLVFYGTPGNVGHVGLYIGDGQMIEAAHTGVPVRIADINRPDLLIGGRPRTAGGSAPPG